TRALNQPADTAKPVVSSQPTIRPTAQPAAVIAKDQPPPQTDSTITEVKPPAKQTGVTESKPQPTLGAAKSALKGPQDQKSADGTGAAQHKLNQGSEYMSGGKYQETRREFEYVKNLDPDNKSVYYLIGQTYHKMNQLERALEAYRQCTSGMYASVA